jgi:phosphohistidine phosphatase
VGPRRLTLLRHGQAQDIVECTEDYERPLTHRGNIQAHEIAKRIVQHDLVPELILASPAERAWSTAQIVAAACELDAKQLQCARELYLATPETVWRILTERAANLGNILICGHNPGLSELASRFGPETQSRDLATAGLATALWQHADWGTLMPEGANRCDFDDPENPAGLD